MATKRDVHPVPIQEVIRIERRELVAEIELSSNGTINPVVAAFNRIGEYLAEEASTNGNRIELEFGYGSVMFRASVEPIANPSQGDNPEPATSW